MSKKVQIDQPGNAERLKKLSIITSSVSMVSKKTFPTTGTPITPTLRLEADSTSSWWSLGIGVLVKALCLKDSQSFLFLLPVSYIPVLRPKYHSAVPLLLSKTLLPSQLSLHRIPTRHTSYSTRSPPAAVLSSTKSALMPMFATKSAAGLNLRSRWRTTKLKRNSRPSSKTNASAISSLITITSLINCKLRVQTAFSMASSASVSKTGRCFRYVYVFAQPSIPPKR